MRLNNLSNKISLHTSANTAIYKTKYLYKYQGIYGKQQSYLEMTRLAFKRIILLSIFKIINIITSRVFNQFKSIT
jgi:hypothetical protein